MTLQLVHDSQKDFNEAKEKIEALMEEINRDYPGFQYVFLGLDPDHVWVLHSEASSITHLLGMIEVAKLSKFEKWKGES